MRGESGGLGGLVTRCLCWQCGQRQPVDDPLVGACGVSFSCRELLFLVVSDCF